MLTIAAKRRFDPDELRAIKRLWVRHSIAEDARDIDGLVATLAPTSVYELVPTGQRRTVSSLRRHLGTVPLSTSQIAAARRFLAGLREAAKRGALVYGECGGYMTLGQGLVDQSGARHAMAGLLPLESSFAARRLHLGYRVVRLLGDAPWADRDQVFRGHEFHYARVIDEGEGEPLFASQDARGVPLGPAGRRAGRVMG